MLQRALHELRVLVFDLLPIGTGAPALLALFLWLCLCLGCAATRANQTMPATEPRSDGATQGETAGTGGPTRAEFEDLRAQQNGLINAVSSISQRVELVATATTTLESRITASVTAKGLGDYVSQFGVGPTVVLTAVLLAALGMVGRTVGRTLDRVCNVVEALSRTIDRAFAAGARLLELDEHGDQARERGGPAARPP